MNAGRELDALVAEKVMGTEGIRTIQSLDHRGWHREPGTLGPSRDLGDGRTGREAIQIPHYSTDIAHAWLVVEHINLFDNGTRLGRDDNGAWVVMDWTNDVLAKADTAPLALCLAALHVIAEREQPGITDALKYFRDGLASVPPREP